MAGASRAELRRAFGVTIRRLREERGIAQEQLALLAGVNRVHMGRLERGEHLPNLGLVYKLIEALNVSLRCWSRRLEEALDEIQQARKPSEVENPKHTKSTTSKKAG